ncbi:hypothetical protein HMPREF1870_00822 [Bacteroidales bacterium KA00344]|nr:hypothetical protein HMPREF1870_00822 [Bacteroidales bacterium KA00344]
MHEKKYIFIWQYKSKAVYLHQKKGENIWGLYRFDWDTHQIKLKTENVSLVDGGPHKALGA